MSNDLDMHYTLEPNRTPEESRTYIARIIENYLDGLKDRGIISDAEVLADGSVLYTPTPPIKQITFTPGQGFGDTTLSEDLALCEAGTVAEKLVTHPGQVFHLPNGHPYEADPGFDHKRYVEMMEMADRMEKKRMMAQLAAPGSKEEQTIVMQTILGGTCAMLRNCGKPESDEAVINLMEGFARIVLMAYGIDGSVDIHAIERREE